MQSELVYDRESPNGPACIVHGDPPGPLADGGGEVTPLSSTTLERSSWASCGSATRWAASPAGATLLRWASRWRTATRVPEADSSCRASAPATTTERWRPPV